MPILYSIRYFVKHWGVNISQHVKARCICSLQHFLKKLIANKPQKVTKINEASANIYNSSLPSIIKLNNGTAVVICSLKQKFNIGDA
jgi:hypothetical protein